MDCFIAKKNKNGTMSVQRKALTDNEMLEVVAFYGSNRLETGYKQDLPLRDGTKVVIVHTEGDNDMPFEVDCIVPKEFSDMFHEEPTKM